VPMDVAVPEEKAHLVKMAGREVFKAAVRSMAEAADQALVRAGLTGEDIDLLIPHQANIRIIEATARYANVPMEKVFVNVDRYGNMSSATVPIALDEAVEQGRVKPGDNVLMVAFGAGFTWASGVIRWWGCCFPARARSSSVWGATWPRRATSPAGPSRKPMTSWGSRSRSSAGTAPRPC